MTEKKHNMKKLIVLLLVFFYLDLTIVQILRDLMIIVGLIVKRNFHMIFAKSMYARFKMEIYFYG